jgi:hypothetical protein
MQDKPIGDFQAWIAGGDVDAKLTVFSAPEDLNRDEVFLRRQARKPWFRDR